jgi:hypothetical protein
MLSKLNPLNCPKPGLMAMGLILACCSAFLTAQAGYEIHGYTMGAAFVICTFGACFVPHEFTDALRSGRYGSALFAGLIAVMFMVGEFAGELMVMSSARGKTDQSAQVQNARYDGLVLTSKNLQAQLDIAKEKLAKQSEYGAAASYDARIKEAEELAQRESSKERSGCKKKCDDAKALAADLRAKQAIAIDRETNTKPDVDRLTAQVEQARLELKNTNKGFSDSKAQVDIIQRVFFGSNDNESQRSRTDDMFTLFMAALLTLGSMGLTWAAKQSYEPRKPKPKAGERPLLTLIKSTSDKLAGRESAKPAATASVQMHREIQIMDPRSACMQLAGHGKCA